MIDIFASNTGQTPEKVKKDMDRLLYMTPLEAKEYGLIDRVLESEKKGASLLTASTKLT
jgi:ATP-dependent Clp protease protease subunit